MRYIPGTEVDRIQKKQKNPRQDRCFVMNHHNFSGVDRGTQERTVKPLHSTAKPFGIVDIIIILA